MGRFGITLRIDRGIADEVLGRKHFSVSRGRESCSPKVGGALLTAIRGDLGRAEFRVAIEQQV